MLRLLMRCRAERPDCVHAFDTKPAVLGRLVARLAGVPVVMATIPGLGSLYSEGQPSRPVLRRVYEVAQRLACAMSDATVFQNEHDASAFVRRKVVAPSKVRLVPGSGVNAGFFDPRSVLPSAVTDFRARHGVAPDALLVTLVTRAIRSKGIGDFCAAADRLRRRGSRAVLMLVSRTDEQSVERIPDAELEAASRSVLHLRDVADVRLVLAASDVFALPTCYPEGIPRALLEAACMELPLITTRVPGCTAVVVEGRTGLFIPRGSPDGIADAVSRLEADPALRRRLGRQARRRAVEHFGISAIAHEAGNLYDELLSRRGAPRMPSTTTGALGPSDAQGGELTC